MFGLFGSIRKKAAEGALAYVRPIMALVQSGIGLPRDFWRDPYVLGFLQAYIGFGAKEATNGKVTGETFGHVIADVYAALSHMNGVAITNAATDFAVDEHPEYVRGNKDAAAIYFFAHGVLKDEANHPLVIAAKDAAIATKRGNDRSTIAALMLQSTILGEVKRLRA